MTPCYEVKVGRIAGACWFHDGWYSVTVVRVYTDKDGKQHKARSFGRDDLLVVAEVMRQCWRWITFSSSSQPVEAGPEQIFDPPGR